MTTVGVIWHIGDSAVRLRHMVIADPRAVLEAADTVAVVGCSTRPYKAAHGIPRMLQDLGFRVIPVHLTASEILGEKAYASLEAVPEPVDLVVVFRPSHEAAGVTRQAIAVGAKAVWLQMGIVSADAEAMAEAAGISFVQDRCSGVDARTFGIDKR